VSVQAEPGGEAVSGLLATVVSENRNDVAVEAYRAGPAALGRAFVPLPAQTAVEPPKVTSAVLRSTAPHRRYRSSPRRAPV
jgi:hypothetical protein